MLALDVAASAPSPRKRPTQIALTVPFSDWRIEEASVGSANSSRVAPMAPASGRRVRAAVCVCHVVLRHAGLDPASALLPPPTRPAPSRSNAARSRSASAALASWSARAFSTASGLARSVKFGLARRAARLSRSFSAAARLRQTGLLGLEVDALGQRKSIGRRRRTTICAEPGRRRFGRATAGPSLASRAKRRMHCGQASSIVRSSRAITSANSVQRWPTAEC